MRSDTRQKLLEALEILVGATKGSNARKWGKETIVDAVEKMIEEKVGFSADKSLAIALLEAENARLHRRIQDLLETNTAYLNRARNVESMLTCSRGSMLTCSRGQTTSV